MAKGPLRSDTCKWKSCCPPPELPPLPATLPQWTEWSAGQVCEPGVTLQSALPHAPLGIHPGLSPLHSTPLPVVFLNCTSDPCTLFLIMSPTCTKTKALCGLESMWSALASLDGLHVALLPLPALQTQATPFSLWPLPLPFPVPRAGSVQPSTSWHVLVLWPCGIGALPSQPCPCPTRGLTSPLSLLSLHCQLSQTTPARLLGPSTKGSA